MSQHSIKLLRITTVPMSLRYLLRGQMRFMASKGLDIFMASASGKEVEEVVKHEGLPHVTFNLTRSITPITDLKVFWQLARWMRTEGVQIVHSHTPKAGLLAMLAARLAGVPLRLHTVAGIPWMEKRGFKRWLLKNVDRLAYASATHVYSNSFGLSDFMKSEKLVKQKKLKVIGQGSSNGINTDFFSPEYSDRTKSELRKELNLTDDDFVFCFIGRVVNDKGMTELAQAFKAMPPKARLLVVGPFEDDLDPISNEARVFLETDPRVKTLGYKNDVRLFLKASDALVFPSYREGFPNVPMQAGAMNLPSIVSDINGCNEIIEHERNGLIVPVKDGIALGEAMNRLMAETDLLTTLTTNARPMIVDRFQQEHVWNEIYKEYLRLLN